MLFFFFFNSCTSVSLNLFLEKCHRVGLVNTILGVFTDCIISVYCVVLMVKVSIYNLLSLTYHYLSLISFPIHEVAGHRHFAQATLYLQHFVSITTSFT